LPEIGVVAQQFPAGKVGTDRAVMTLPGSRARITPSAVAATPIHQPFARPVAEAVAG
jgi:hypothetical protein